MARLLSALLLVFPGAVTAQGWLETRAEIEALAEASDFAAAAALGPALLDSVRGAFGESSEQLAESHLLVADVYKSNGLFLDAEAEYAAAIDIIRLNDGTFSTALIGPFTGLGEAYFGAGELELAITAFDEARTIGRRAHGLLNQDQLPLLERMSIAALGLGDFDRARDYREDMANVARRYFGPESLEYLDASFRYAEWLSDHGAYQDARYVHVDIQDVIDDHFDEDPMLTVKRLRLASDHVPVFNTQPVELNEALKVIESMENPDPEVHAELLLELGDWHVARGRNGGFQDYYASAWELLDSIGNGEALRREWFTELVVLRSGPLVSRYLSLEPAAPEGFVRLRFDIDTFGQARNIVVVESDPPQLLDRAAMRQIANSRFRPHMRDGQLIESESFFVWQFRYEIDDRNAAGDGAARY